MADDRKTGKMTEEERVAFEAKLDAALAIHSGHPQVTVQEWALLVRARADRPVSFEDIATSLIIWFEPILSAQEFFDLIFGADEKGWVAITQDEHGMRHVQTMGLGEQVLAAVQRPLMMAGVFSLTGKDLLPPAGDEEDNPPVEPPIRRKPFSRSRPQSPRRP